MARKALILPLLLLASCQTDQKRIEAAAVTQGNAAAVVEFPDLPDACTAKTGRVTPKADEPRVVTLKRWEVVADNRDRKADDCAKWGAGMKQNWGK